MGILISFAHLLSSLITSSSPLSGGRKKKKKLTFAGGSVLLSFVCLFVRLFVESKKLSKKERKIGNPDGMPGHSYLGKKWSNNKIDYTSRRSTLCSAGGAYFPPFLFERRRRGRGG